MRAHYGGSLSQKEAKANPDIDITGIIQSSGGLTDPEEQFYILSGQTEQAMSIIDLMKSAFASLADDLTIEVRHFQTANTLILKSPEAFGDHTVLSFMIDRILTTDQGNGFKMSQIGNLEVFYENIRISLSPAGANEDELNGFVQALQVLQHQKNGSLVFNSGHVGKMTFPGLSDIFVFRFNPLVLNSGIVSDTVQFYDNGDGTLRVEYRDGRIQNLIPYINRPYEFIRYTDSLSLNCQIDWLNGEIEVKNSTNEGFSLLPEYWLDPSKSSESATFELRNGAFYYRNLEGEQVLNLSTKTNP